MTQVAIGPNAIRKLENAASDELVVHVRYRTPEESSEVVARYTTRAESKSSAKFLLSLVFYTFFRVYIASPMRYPTACSSASRQDQPLPFLDGRYPFHMTYTEDRPMA